LEVCVSTILFENDNHRSIMLPDFDAGQGVQANQHVIVHGKEAIILDPGGHKVYNKVLAATFAAIKGSKLRHIFLSHQDPDIVAAVNGWLMTTDATAWSSKLWLRFIPHFGLDRLVIDRLVGIPDEGMKLDLGGAELWVLPAHFLHSTGNFMVYDPISKILYSGDLGASVEQDYLNVTDFDAHIKYTEGFHRRYMTSTRALRACVAMIRQLDVETVAPQHGAMYRGKELVGRWLDWLDTLEVGIDVYEGLFKLPE